MLPFKKPERLPAAWLASATMPAQAGEPALVPPTGIITVSPNALTTTGTPVKGSA